MKKYKLITGLKDFHAGRWIPQYHPITFIAADEDVLKFMCSIHKTPTGQFVQVEKNNRVPEAFVLTDATQKN
jgi:hypothetical protein